MKKLLFIILCIAILLPIVTISTLPNSTVKAAPSHGFISITFDDGNTNQYEIAWPLMQARGMVGTFYIIPSIIDPTGVENMNVSDLIALQNAGNEIGSHSATHPNLTANLSESQLIQEINGSKQTLQSYGLTITNFAYPGGVTNDTVDQYVAQYYRSGRTYVNNNETYPIPVPNDWTDIPGFYQPHAYSAINDDTTMNLTKLESFVDDIYNNDRWGVVTFHNVLNDPSGVEYSISTANFITFLDYIASKGVATLTVNAALNLGTTQTLTMATNAGTTSPSVGTHTYDVGESIAISATHPTETSGMQYVFVNWTGTGAGSYSGTNPTPTIAMTGDITETAYWKIQYSLTVTSAQDSPTPSTGENWYDSGTPITAYISSPVSGVTGVQYLCTGWTGTGSVPSSGSSSVTNFTITAPSTITWNWKTQYYLNLTSAHGAIGGSGWYDADTSAIGTVSSTTVSGTTGTQYVFTDWSGDASGSVSPSNPIVMSSPKSGTANWKTQYNLTLTQTGANSDFTGTMLTVNGTNYGKDGFFVWANASDVYTFSYGSELVVGANSKQYALTGVSGNSSAQTLTATGAMTITGAYKTQYYLTVTSTYGSPSPTSGWYDSGSSINESVNTTATSDGGTQYCTGWTGTGSVPNSGSVSVFTFTINEPSSITWNWSSNWMDAYGIYLIAGISIAAAAAIILGGFFFYRRRK